MSTALFSIPVELRRSFWFTTFRRAYSVLLLVLLFQVGWDVLVQIGLLAVLVVAVLFVETRQVSSLDSVMLRPQGVLLLRNHGGDWVEAQSVHASLVHPWLTVFSAKFSRDTHYWAIFPDCCNAEAFRQLRVWLNWEVKHASQNAPSS